ncbi:MAG TPA: cobalt transporter CbiM, partial [Kiritimatiellae bacterium]|nr:cobalt transporter CbiM [Kiritimatiellia bacterium]
RGLGPDRLPLVAVMGSAFFVASLIHVPVGPSSAHLILNGLCGLLLGWAAFPALLVSLFLQAVLFGFGGISTLGVNTFDMAGPAVLAGMIFGKGCGARAGRRQQFAAGFGAGAAAVLGGCLATAAALFLSGRELLPAAAVLAAAHVPVALVEGLVTGWAVVFLGRVWPDIWEGRGK